MPENESLFVIMAEKIERLENANRRYKSALRFYADMDNYESVQIGSSYISRVQMDGGVRARETLYGREDEQEVDN